MNQVSKKTILVVTGIRSDYDILFPVIDSLRKDEEFEVKVVVCGTHLSDWHGNTEKVIKEDGFNIVERIDYLLMTNRITQRSKGTGNLIAALTQTVEREKPDFIMFVGDREESIASCVVANYMNVLCVHIGGGDTVYGNADDPIRFACSELAHIHFATSKAYANNLLSIGEEPRRVCFSGNPALKNIKDTPLIGLDLLSKELGVDLKEYIVILKHPLSSVKEEAYRQMKVTLEAIEDFIEETGLKAIGIYPNTDPGSYDILKAIEEIKNTNIFFYKTLKRDIFVNLMRKAKLLIGNSSMGILEAPFYKIPVVNVGERQKGRLNAGNVEFVNYVKEEIVTSLHKAAFNKIYRRKIRALKNPYGRGDADIKILKFLKKVDLQDKSWYIKRKIFKEG